MMRRLHIVLLAWCWMLLSAAAPVQASGLARHPATCPSEECRIAPAEPAASASVASLCVDRAPAAEWLCERACNSDLEPPRPAGGLIRSGGASDNSRAGGHSLSRTLRPVHAEVLRRAAAYRRTLDSRLLFPSGGDSSVRFGRLLI